MAEIQQGDTSEAFTGGSWPSPTSPVATAGRLSAPLYGDTAPKGPWGCAALWQACLSVRRLLQGRRPESESGDPDGSSQAG